MRKLVLMNVVLGSATIFIGCDDATEMEIDSPSTTHPAHFDREISDDAVDGDQGTQRTSEQVANTETDSTGPSQEQSLAGAYNLDDFRGQRVLLVFAGSPEVPAYEQLKSQWQQNNAALKEQGIVLVESLLRGSSPAASKTLSDGESQVIRSRYGIQPPQFKVMLIAEDGQPVQEWEDDVAFDEILKAATAGGEEPSTGSDTDTAPQ